MADDKTTPQGPQITPQEAAELRQAPGVNSISRKAKSDVARGSENSDSSWGANPTIKIARQMSAPMCPA